MMEFFWGLIVGYWICFALCYLRDKTREVHARLDADRYPRTRHADADNE